MEQARYKYMAYTPGFLTAYSWRLPSLLRSGSTILMDHAQVGELHHSWFSLFLKPLVHFLPVQPGFRDVADIVAWAKANDATAESIAHQAAHFAKVRLNDACAADAIVLMLALLTTHERFQLHPHGQWLCPSDCTSVPLL